MFTKFIKSLPKSAINWNSAHVPKVDQQLAKITSQADFLKHKPQKPANGYLLFVKEAQVSKPKHQHQQNFIKLVSQNWKELSDEAKQPYILKSQKMFEKYKVDMESFLENLNDDEKEQMKSMFKEKKNARQKRTTKQAKLSFGRPKLPKTGYMVFVQSQFPHYIIKSATDTNKTMTSIANEWKGMSDSLKERYNVKARQDKERYENEMVEYVKRLKEAGRKDLLPSRNRTGSNKIN